MARKDTPPKPIDPADDTPSQKIRRLLDAKRGARSHQDIADAAGMSESKLSQILTGRIKDPRASTFVRLLKAIGATLKDYERA